MLAVPTDAQSLTKQVLYALIGALVSSPASSRLPARATPGCCPAAGPRRLGHISYAVFCIHLACCTSSCG